MKTNYSSGKFHSIVMGIVIIWFIIGRESSFAQRFEWVSFTPIASGYPNGGTGGKAVTIDNSGNIYTLADFSEPVVTGEDTIVPFFPGSTDIFLTKWSPVGNVLWARPFGGNWYDDGLNLAFDGVNNLVYASAHIQGAQTYLNDTILTNTSDYQILVFDTAGNFIKNRFTGWSNIALAIKDEVIYFTDNWSTIRRVDTEGNIIFSLSPSSMTGYFFFRTVEITPQYDLLAAGIFSGSFVLEGDTIESVASPSGEHTFLVKADSSGQLIFAVYAGSFGLTYTSNIPIASDESGNTYMSDTYSHNGVIFGLDTLPHLSLNRDAFIARFDSSGNSVWGRHFYGTADTEPMDMIHRDGYLFNCGRYAGMMVFDATTLPNSGAMGYISRMSDSGEYSYAKEVGSYNGSSWAAEIGYSGSDRYLISGMTYGGGSNSVFGCFTQAYPNQYLTEFKDTVKVMPEVSINISENYLVADDNCECSVQWYLDGDPVAGATKDSLLISENGDYYAIVADDYNCSAQSNTITIVNAGVSALLDSQIKISPNPFHSSIKIEITGTPSPEKYSMKIMNMAGQTLNLLSGDDYISQNNISLDLSSINRGIYLLELKFAGLRITRKIVKR